MADTTPAANALESTLEALQAIANAKGYVTTDDVLEAWTGEAEIDAADAEPGVDDEIHTPRELAA